MSPQSKLSLNITHKESKIWKITKFRMFEDNAHLPYMHDANSTQIGILNINVCWIMRKCNVTTSI